MASDITLDQLHATIQAAFGWLGGHLWVFTTAEGEYGLPDPELGHVDAAGRTLVAVAPRPGDRLRYTYDFGDDWEHEILVEDVTGAEPGVAYPRCLTGRRAAPPDDCGGIWGYQDLLEALADPAHPEHAERLEWLGLYSAGDLDPSRFDRVRVDAALSRLATVIEPD
ncbi:MAG: plasmid pRiA4b ORF-3 family protein [Tomitella sp.]|nr:plasmid pRiA4b ORF-3 family protein [Tomitella sp.]